MKRQPVVLCLVGTFIAIPVSHMTHMYFGGTLHGTIEFTKAAMLFALLIVVVDRWSRFEKLITIVACMATVVVLLCLVDYYAFIEFDFIKHAVENYGVSATGEDLRIVRMSGTGIFSDPNDISLLIVASGIICSSFLFTASGDFLAWAGSFRC